MRIFQYKSKAYFSVEAAMVLSMVLSTIVFLIYLMLFQYNRCLQEQDLGLLVVKSSMLQAQNGEALMNELITCRDGLSMDKYVAWQEQTIELELEGKRLSVSGSGRMPVFPMEWEAEAAYEGQVISPVFLIRSYRQLVGAG